MTGAVLLVVDAAELMELGFSRLQALRVLAERDALSPRITSPPPSTPPTQPLSPPSVSPIGSRMPAGNPSEWSHEEMMVWTDKIKWQSKSQKKRVVAALQEEEISGSGLELVAESDTDQAHKTLAEWGVKEENDRTLLIKTIKALFTQSSQQPSVVSHTSSIPSESATIPKLHKRGIQITSVLKRKCDVAFDDMTALRTGFVSQLLPSFSFRSKLPLESMLTLTSS